MYLRALQHLETAITATREVAARRGQNLWSLDAASLGLGTHGEYVRTELKILGASPAFIVLALGVLLVAKSQAVHFVVVFVLVTLVYYMVRCAYTAVDVAEERLKIDGIAVEFLEKAKQADQEHQRFKDLANPTPAP